MPPAAPATRHGVFSGFTRLSKLMAFVIIVLYFVTKFVPSSQAYLALVPGRTIPCVWNIVTSQFVETHGALVVLDVFAILFLAKIVEPIYGSKEFLKFTVIVNLMAGFIVFVVLFISYMLGPRMGYLLYGKYCGFQALLAAYLVAIKQIMPDSELRLLFVLKLKAKYLPLMYVIITAAVAGALEAYFTIALVLSGMYTSWLYLRLFQTKLDGKLVGDPSDEFRFATFFPEILHNVIDKICAIITCCRSKRANIDTTGYVLQGQPLPGSDSQESNRRRERGQRALDERLASGTAGDIESGVEGEKGAADGSQQLTQATQRAASPLPGK